MIKPTKYEIRKYLTEFVEGLDGMGLIITDYDEFEAEMDKIAETDYPVLRELFEDKEIKNDCTV